MHGPKNFALRSRSKQREGFLHLHIRLVRQHFDFEIELSDLCVRFLIHDAQEECVVFGIGDHEGEALFPYGVYRSHKYLGLLGIVTEPDHGVWIWFRRHTSLLKR